MNKRLSFLLLTSCMLWLVSCQKENITTANSKLISSQNSTADAAAARQKVYVKAIRPYSDSVIGGDVFPVTVVLNKPAPAGGFRANVTTSRPTGPIVDVPAYTIIPEGDSTGTILVHTIPVRAEEIEVFFVGPALDPAGLLYLVAVLPRPASDTRPPLQFLEAENAIFYGAHAVFGGDTYFSNNGYAVYDKNSGGSVKFNFTVSKSGKYFLVLRYATPQEYTGKTVEMEVVFNGYKTTVGFSASANENAVQIVNYTQYLKAGMNEVIVKSMHHGTLRLDYLEVAAE